MNSQARKSAVLALGGVALLLFLASGPALADTLTGTTTVTFSSNPVTLVAGNDVTITTTTTAPDHSSSPPTTATLIDQGKVTIELATDESGNPVPAASVVTWVALNAPGQSPVAGVTSLALDLDNLSALGLGLSNFTPGTTGGFRAHYVTGGGQIRSIPISPPLLTSPRRRPAAQASRSVRRWHLATGLRTPGTPGRGSSPSASRTAPGWT